MDQLVDGYGMHVYPDADPHRPVAARTASLDQSLFAACRQGAKPCWLTEWGIPNGSDACPIDETTAAGRIAANEVPTAMWAA